MPTAENKNTLALMRILTELSINYSEHAKRIDRFIELLAYANDEELPQAQENILNLLQNFNIVTNQAAATQQAMAIFRKDA
jgi:hypothetical protein